MILNWDEWDFSVGLFGAVVEFTTLNNKLMKKNTKTYIGKKASINLKKISKNITVWEDCLPKGLNWSQKIGFEQNTNKDFCDCIQYIGKNKSSIRKEFRDYDVFSLISMNNISFNIASKEKKLIEYLKKNIGSSVFREDIYHKIINHQPIRIGESNIARIEVYSPIPKTKSPIGPHTHLLKKLTDSKKTHSSNYPLKYSPGLMAYHKHQYQLEKLISFEKILKTRNRSLFESKYRKNSSTRFEKNIQKVRQKQKEYFQ